jgi:hypothetical protein
MLKQTDVMAIFVMLESGGLRPPEVWQKPENRRIAVEVWQGALGDIGPQQLRVAAVAYLRTPSPFWPTPGQLLALIPGRPEANLDDSDEAWGIVMEGISKHGWSSPPTPMGNPIGDGKWRYCEEEARCKAIEAGVQAAGGWRALCLGQEDQMAPARASFRAAYRTVMQRRAIEAEYQAIAGLLPDMESPKRLTGSGMRRIGEGA